MFPANVYTEINPEAVRMRMHSWRALATAIETASIGDRGPATALRVAGPHVAQTGYDRGVNDDRTAGEPDDPPRRADPILSADVGRTPVDWTAPGADGTGGVGPATLANGMVLAGVGTRLAAFLVDFFVLGCAAIAISLLSTSLIADPDSSNTVAAVGSAALAVAYFAVAWISPWSATPGQRLAGLRVVDAATLQSIDAGRAVFRSLALGSALNLLSFAAPIGRLIGALLIIWPFVLFATTIYGPRRQGLHDRWTRTLVVRPPDASSFPLTLGCFVIVLIILAAPLIIATAAGPSLQEWLQEIQRSAPR